MKDIVFNRDKLRRLKKAYAMNINKDSFSIKLDGEDIEFLTRYAKYLIEYLESQFQKGVN